jgi:predicted aspartyl protease
MKTASLLALAAALLGVAAHVHADDAPHRCKYVLAAKLPIRYVGAGLQPAVDGGINGMPATLLLDTGADRPYLTMTAALKRDLKLSILPGWVQGVGGRSRMFSTRLEEITVGPARVRRPEMTVIYNTAVSLPFDGIIGASFLLAMDMELDLRARQIRFFQPQECEKARLNIWKQDTVSVPFEFTRDRSDNPHFAVLINGKRVDAEIDSGASSTFLTLAGARRIGIDTEGKGARRLSDAFGVGSEHAGRWNVNMASVQIGDETINDPAIDVLDIRGAASAASAELYLGQDFLRAHHVLFAMSQQKIYFAYLGGPAFASNADRAAFVREEADAGNPDAQYLMALANGADAGQSWLARAASAGQPNAMLEQGRRQYAAGKPAEAATTLRAGLDALPSDRYAPLWLYLARIRNGQAALARTELSTSLEKQRTDDWPAPIADFYLGRSDAAKLLDTAGTDASRRCEAGNFMAEWRAANGDAAAADALWAAAKTDCARRPGAVKAAAQ